MINRFLLVIGALFFLASCETATQNALKGTAGKAGKAGSGSASIFGSAKQTPADKLISVGDNFAYEARSIHYNGKKKSKGIYGSVSKEDLKELKEEGIDAQMIPWIDEKEN